MTIVMLNGWSPFPLPLHVVRQQYRRRGHDSVVVPFRQRDMRDVESFAVHAVRFIREHCARTGERKIHLMGISLGALAGVFALQRLHAAPLIGTFAAIGGPLHGSPLSALAMASGMYLRLGLQLRPHGRFIERLWAKPLPAGPTYVAVAGDHDYTCPPWSALIPGAYNHILPFGHGGVLGHPGIPPVVVPYLAR